MKEIFAIVASILAVAGNLPYLWSILRGEVRPHPYTWFVWTIVSGIVFFGQLAKGAGIGALPTASAEIFTLIIFLVSLKYGFKGVSKVDTLFLIIALFGVALWIGTHDPTPSIIIAVSIDLIAFIPTLRKTWLQPTSESPILFGSNVLRHILSLLSLETYNIATTLHSIVMIVVNTVMTSIILLGKRTTQKL